MPNENEPTPTTDNVVVTAPARIERAGDVAFFAVPRGVSTAQVDLSAVEWISPIGIVGLLALTRRAERDGLSVVAIIAPESAVVRDYLVQVGFVEALERQGMAIQETLLASRSAQPIRPCLQATFVASESEMERTAARLWTVLDANGASPQIANAMYIIMTELTNNGWEHGSGCFVVAQTHTGQTSRTPGVHLAIADLGPGFRETLARYAPASEAEAVALALEDQVSGTGDAMRGFGLSNVLSSVEGMAGELSIISGDAWLRWRDGRAEYVEGPDCRGVFVAAYLPFQP